MLLVKYTTSHLAETVIHTDCERDLHVICSASKASTKFLKSMLEQKQKL